MKQRSWLAILLSFAGPCRGKLVLSVICAIISVAGGFVPYLGVYEILRLFIHQSASGMELLRWAGVCLAGYAVKVAFYAFSTMLAHVSAYTILEGLRRQVAHKLMHAPLGSVLSKPVGSLKSTIVDRIEDIEPPLAHMIPELSSNVLLPIVVVISLFAMDWRVGLASLATIPAALIPMAAGLRTYNEKYAAYMAANAQVNSIIVEYVEGIEVVKAFNQSGASYEKFVRAVTSFRDFTLDWFRCTWKSMNLCLSILPTTLLATLPVGIALYQTGVLDPSRLALCLMLVLGIVSPLVQAAAFLNSMKSMEFAVRDTRHLLDLEELRDVLSAIRFLGCRGTTGTEASFLSLFEGDSAKIDEMNRKLAASFGFDRLYDVCGQTYPRKLDSRILNVLSSIAQSCCRFANDIRLLQHDRQVEEPFEESQVGSSAMPYKRNPMRCERSSQRRTF